MFCPNDEMFVVNGKSFVYLLICQQSNSDLTILPSRSDTAARRVCLTLIAVKREV